MHWVNKDIVAEGVKTLLKTKWVLSCDDESLTSLSSVWKSRSFVRCQRPVDVLTTLTPKDTPIEPHLSERSEWTVTNPAGRVDHQPPADIYQRKWYHHLFWFICAAPVTNWFNRSEYRHFVLHVCPRMGLLGSPGLSGPPCYSNLAHRYNACNGKHYLAPD